MPQLRQAASQAAAIAEVQRLGVTTKKQSSALLQVVAVYRHPLGLAFNLGSFLN